MHNARAYIYQTLKIKYSLSLTTILSNFGHDAGIVFLYGIVTEELVICEIRIDGAAGRGDSDSRMTSFEVFMPLKQSSKIFIKAFNNLCTSKYQKCCPLKVHILHILPVEHVHC